MLDHFGNKVFLGHQTQGNPDHVLQKSYAAEQESFKRPVRVVSRSSVPCSANFVSSHVLYKIKIDEIRCSSSRIGLLLTETRIASNMSSDLKVQCVLQWAQGS